jgi:hypothetical protein
LLDHSVDRIGINGFKLVSSQDTGIVHQQVDVPLADCSGQLLYRLAVSYVYSGNDLDAKAVEFRTASAADRDDVIPSFTQLPAQFQPDSPVCPGNDTDSHMNSSSPSEVPWYSHHRCACMLNHFVLASAAYMLRQGLPALCLSLAIIAGCATASSQSDVLHLPGDDDQAAASELADFLASAQLPVEKSPVGNSLFVYRRGMATLLSPVLQNDGLDRIIATRSYAPAPGREDQDLAGLAFELNDQLNVGGFAVADGALIYETNLTFVDRVSLDEIRRFLDWLDDVELAIKKIDHERGVLLLTAT